MNNIRNTRNIHSWIKEKTHIGDQIISNDICGCDPEIHSYSNLKQVDVFINNVLLQLISEESVSAKSIVVLVNDSKVSDWIGKQYGQYCLRSTVENEKTEIKIATVSEFKGLESSIIIYLNDWPESIPKSNDYYYRLYVAGTRAKYYLYVVDYPG